MFTGDGDYLVWLSYTEIISWTVDKFLSSFILGSSLEEICNSGICGLSFYVLLILKKKKKSSIYIFLKKKNGNCMILLFPRKETEII